MTVPTSHSIKKSSRPVWSLSEQLRSQTLCANEFSIAKTWKTRLLRCSWVSLTRSTVSSSLRLLLWCIRWIQQRDNLNFTSWWLAKAVQILMLKNMLTTLRNPIRRSSRPASLRRHSSNTNKVTIKKLWLCYLRGSIFTVWGDALSPASSRRKRLKWRERRRQTKP